MASKKSKPAKRQQGVTELITKMYEKNRNITASEICRKYKDLKPGSVAAQLSKIRNAKGKAKPAAKRSPAKTQVSGKTRRSTVNNEPDRDPRAVEKIEAMLTDLQESESKALEDKLAAERQRLYKEYDQGQEQLLEQLGNPPKPKGRASIPPP